MRNQNTSGGIFFLNQDELIKEKFRFSLAESINCAVLDQEFFILYQPKVDLADMKCVGAEVLLRWNHPQLKLIYPDVFIPVAEEMGFIRTLTRWVIGRVVDDLNSGFNSDFFLTHKLVIAINLSVADLKDRDLVPYIVEQVNRGSSCHDHIEFEITESMLIDDDPQIKENLAGIQKLGFRLSIDDFGTGYSSLSSLHTFQIDNLKIDQSFVRLITGGEMQAPLPVLDAIISMGLSLGVELTAEGIETDEQAEYLRVRGCQTAQGWLYSKGLYLNEFIKYVESE